MLLPMILDSVAVIWMDYKVIGHDISLTWINSNRKVTTRLIGILWFSVCQWKEKWNHFFFFWGGQLNIPFLSVIGRHWLLETGIENLASIDDKNRQRWKAFYSFSKSNWRQKVRWKIGCKHRDLPPYPVSRQSVTVEIKSKRIWYQIEDKNLKKEQIRTTKSGGWREKESE